jgi:mRNA interferase HigB
VVVISKTILVAFGQKHADAAEPLNDWWIVAKGKQWKSLHDIKKDFSSVDFVGNDRFVFNIKGNKYRLVAMIFFDIRTIYMRYVGRHAEYDRIDCSTI